MKTTVKIEKEVEIKTLEVDDEMGDLTPFRKGDLWCPIIDIDSGIIKDWPQGITASIHFKICDEGSYYLKDESGNTVLSIEQDYVPSILCSKENGYGDYIIMDIDEMGKYKIGRQIFHLFSPKIKAVPLLKVIYSVFGLAVRWGLKALNFKYRTND